MRTLLRRAGFTRFTVVPAQARPDPDFSTVPVPNPEDMDAYRLAFRLADQVKADLVLATDPDADRLGVALRGADGSFRVLTGNQIGCLLLHHLLRAKNEAGTLPGNGLVIRSAVSTPMADAICARFGAAIEEVPTGFRFISERIAECARTREKEFLFGFEESYGFLYGDASRDKDGVSAALLAVEAAARCAAEGKTLSDALRELYEEYGWFRDKVLSFTLKGKTGRARIDAAMEALRAEPPAEMAGLKLESVEDCRAGVRRDAATGAKTPSFVAGPDMLRLRFAGGAYLYARPSGTEPKFKLYIGVSDADEGRSREKFEAVFSFAEGYFGDLLRARKK